MGCIWMIPGMGWGCFSSVDSGLSNWSMRDIKSLPLITVKEHAALQVFILSSVFGSKPLTIVVLIFE